MQCHLRAQRSSTFNRGLLPCPTSKSLYDKSCQSEAIFEKPLWHPRAAPISLNSETLNYPILFTKLMIKFHIWNHQRNLTTTIINIVSFAQIAIIKSVFLKLDRSACAVLSVRLRALTVSIATGTSNGSCSDALTLPISYWLFNSGGGASWDWAAILSVAFSPIQNHTSDMSWVFYSLCLHVLSFLWIPWIFSQ